MAVVILLCRRSAQKIVAHSTTLVVTPRTSLEKIPYESESYDEVAVWVIWCGVEFVFACPSGIEMFGFQKDAALADSGIDEEIEIGETSDFLFVLYKKIRYDRVVTVGVVFREIVECDSGLQIERLGEEIIRKIECVARDHFWYV